MKLESQVQQEIMIEAAKYGCILMRNNSGAFKDENGRVVFFGLGNISKAHGERMKSSDLIGIWDLKNVKTGLMYYTPSQINLGIFIAIEVKREGWVFKPNDKREQAQKAFIDFITSRGGIAGFCTSVDDFKKLIGVA